MAGATPDRNCVSGAKDIGRACGLAARLQGLMAYDGVRIALGALLLTAAALKGHQLATEPVAETGLLTSRWFLIGVVEFELFFGLWLLAGLYPRRTWQVALLCFSGFTCVTLYKALSGEASCGCFGRVPVNPWHTLVLDLAAVTALFRWRSATNPAPCPRPVGGEGPPVRAGPRRQLACVLVISLLVGLPTAVAMGRYQAATLDEAGDIFGDSEFVVLEPEKWIGKRFPLLKYIDIGDQLAEGKWIVILYHHDCPKCQKMVRGYRQAVPEMASQRGAPQVALIEVPPYAEARRAGDAGPIEGRLKHSRDWFLVTAVVVVVRERRVIKVGKS